MGRRPLGTGFKQEYAIIATAAPAADGATGEEHA
jgi:hypothetical protein